MVGYHDRHDTRRCFALTDRPARTPFLHQRRLFSGDARPPVPAWKASEAASRYEIPPPTTEFKDLENIDETSDKTFSYLMVGAFATLGAFSAKALVTNYLSNLSAAADVLAVSKSEINMSAVPEGSNLLIKWQGKPVFVRHRTAEEIAEADSVDLSELRDKQTDAERFPNQEWSVMLGVCTHLGCVPVGESGEYGGWYCPCHGSHYDISGRIRKGPAPLNLEIPPYNINEDEGTIVIG
ncbi:hypothetical protein CXG81DRAFT_13635 [Caulochytrium protostelioides]|uniref:Cytochrome b-c1 complex subunit Rieske, mitochondrial n=1 Tax=Caulochytrium protostelioides TaxID=1555241 RepID=A0A4P9X4T6_9FUNG|nr:hypothetical protein CXG81DRAFT_13635 [Caulochytrium protostelioides]|eukprot:RKP00107.1 hypothetical protein CXG81DRAFT_13635 [Caulochytrium protostelioides]